MYVWKRKIGRQEKERMERSKPNDRKKKNRRYKQLKKTNKYKIKI